jgi:hypothetical protein
VTTTVGKPREPSSGYKNKNKRKCLRRDVLAFKLERTDTTLDLSQKAFADVSEVHYEAVVVECMGWEQLTKRAKEERLGGGGSDYILGLLGARLG